MGKPYALPTSFAPKVLSEVYPGLFHGKRPATYVGYDLVVSCEEFLARKPTHGYTGVTLHVPLRDEDGFKIPRHVLYAAEMVADFVEDGKQALVHCSGGLNRSALVTAWALHHLLGCDHKTAIEILRRKHDRYVLCNRQFERWVTGERLPTAETSAFREVE